MADCSCSGSIRSAAAGTAGAGATIAAGTAAAHRHSGTCCTVASCCFLHQRSVCIACSCTASNAELGPMCLYVFALAAAAAVARASAAATSLVRPLTLVLLTVRVWRQIGLHPHLVRPPRLLLLPLLLQQLLLQRAASWWRRAVGAPAVASGTGQLAASRTALLGCCCCCLSQGLHGDCAVAMTATAAAPALCCLPLSLVLVAITSMSVLQVQCAAAELVGLPQRSLPAGPQRSMCCMQRGHWDSCAPLQSCC